MKNRTLKRQLHDYFSENIINMETFCFIFEFIVFFKATYVRTISSTRIEHNTVDNIFENYVE